MAKNFTICVGTLGMGLWRSPDGGLSWARGKLWKGYQGGRSVFGLAVHPQDPRLIYAGADDGIYRSEDRGANFEHIDSPLDGYKVWRIAIDPLEPSMMFAGTAPPALFRSRDSGQHWEKLPADFSTECINVRTPRVTALVVDPLDHKFVWAEAKIEGDSVVLWSKDVSKPVAVRYAWADNPVTNLFNKIDLPANPFRTDDWPGVTMSRK